MRYIGKSDDYYNPPRLTVKLEALANTQSALKYCGTTRAFLNNGDMTSKDGKYAYDCNHNNQYATIEAVVTAKAPQSVKPGEQMIIETNFFSTNKLGHQYIYTWNVQ